MTRLIILAACSLFLLGAAEIAQAEDGFQFPSLNPFRKKEAGKTSAAKPSGSKGVKYTISDDDGGGFSKPKLKMPKMSLPKFELPLLPDKPKKAAKKSNFFSSSSQRKTGKPSAWDKVSGGTKSFFAKTSEKLNPWSKTSSKKRSTARSSSTTGAKHWSSNTKIAKKEKKPFYKSWFAEKEPEPKRPTTVAEFLKQPRTY